MAISTVKVTAKGLEKKKKRLKYVKRLFLILFLLMLAVFFILMVVYKGGNFTVTLDPQAVLNGNLVLYENSTNKDFKNKLYAKELEFMDNISVKWLPNNLDISSDGSHNGENYIAYTFYIANEGKEIINYWYQINMLDIIKNVDEAIRIMIYENGNRIIYGKKNSITSKVETTADESFYDNKIAVLKQKKSFKPGDVDKYTVVIYLEGDDEDCVDAIIGGEIKLNMEFREEHKEKNGL